MMVQTETFKKHMIEKFSSMTAEKIAKTLAQDPKKLTQVIGKKLKKKLIDISMLEDQNHPNYLILTL